MKAIEQYFPAVQFIMLYKVVLNFESMDGVLQCDHSNDNPYTVCFFGTSYYVVQSDSNF